MRGKRLVGVVTAVLLLAAACGDDDTEPEPDATGEPAGYVALGDSFSAGGGAPPYEGPCARSENGWPHIVEGELDLVDSVDVRACGGATVDLLLGTGSNGAATAQVPDEPDEDVALVTLTIGGNDAAVITAIAACAALDCSPFVGSQELTDALDQLTDRLVEDVYPALRAAYPNARLVHVGYARLTPAAGEDIQACPWLAGPARDAPEQIIAALNDALRDATAQVPELEVAFLDVTDALAGHELCTFLPWVHSLSDGLEALHPDADGYKAIGRAIAGSIET